MSALARAEYERACLREHERAIRAALSSANSMTEDLRLPASVRAEAERDEAWLFERCKVLSAAIERAGSEVARIQLEDWERQQRAEVAR